MWILSQYRYFRFSKVENMVIVEGLGHREGGEMWKSQAQE